MMKLIEEAPKIFKVVNAHLGDLEDFADRFNYIGCALVLLVCTLAVSTKQYFFTPISCFIATEVGGTNLLHYVENYCWVQGTVPITYTGRMPSNDEEWNELEERKIRESEGANVMTAFGDLDLVISSRKFLNYFNSSSHNELITNTHF